MASQGSQNGRKIARPQNSQKIASKRAGQGSKMVSEITHFKIESRGLVRCHKKLQNGQESTSKRASQGSQNGRSGATK